MPLLIRDMRLTLGESEDELPRKAASFLEIAPQDIRHFRIVRQSIDARNKKDIRFEYAVQVTLTEPSLEERLAQRLSLSFEREEPPAPIRQGESPLHLRPVIAGAGPAGLFCAWELARHGYAPLLIERGQPVERRAQDFARLCLTGETDPESNVCFGEGGAGAFSDGKLTTRIKGPRAREVLDILVEAGAPEDIRYAAKPHLGTEHIRESVKNIRQKIIARGGEVMFGAKLSGLVQKDGRLQGIRMASRGTEETVPAEVLVLALGHSSRDTFTMLRESGLIIMKKPFAIGLRIEHPREFIDRAQYGAFAGHPRLGAAEYRLASRFGERGVYTFCMCPGGEVVNSSTEEGATAVNGMSFYSRAAQNSNSAVVVSVGTDDLTADALAGVEFQRHWERLCFGLGGGRGIPAQRLEDFLMGRQSNSFGMVRPSVRPYATPADLNACLPEYVSAGIKAGLKEFGRQVRGFDMGDAVLTGVETRTSSPVTFPRTATYEAEGFPGVYPAGEGAGHAGGIVSAAVDGLKIAQAIIEKYKPEL